VNFLADGDHDLTPRKSSGRSREENWADGMDLITEFVARL
jgi:predicted alpha/beta-hydrolase family hydrolase